MLLLTVQSSVIGNKELSMPSVQYSHDGVDWFDKRFDYSTIMRIVTKNEDGHIYYSKGFGLEQEKEFKKAY